jgi:hypothetical protein
MDKAEKIKKLEEIIITLKCDKTKEELENFKRYLSYKKIPLFNFLDGIKDNLKFCGEGI